MQTPSSPDLGKILMEFDSRSNKRLEKATTVSHSSANPVASNSSWEAYRSWMNFEVSRMKDIGYTIAENKFCTGFVPLMGLWKLRNSQLCLPTPEVKEVSPKLMVVAEEETTPITEPAHHIEESVAPKPSAPEPKDAEMEEAPNQIVVSEAFASQPILVSLLRTIE